MSNTMQQEPMNSSCLYHKIAAPYTLLILFSLQASGTWTNILTSFHSSLLTVANETVSPFLEPTNQWAKTRNTQNSNFSQKYHERNF
jgi:uncharacterized protein with gpF-like domain